MAPDYPIHNTIGRDVCMLYFKEMLVKIPINLCISFPEDCFTFANSADPDEICNMQYFIWVFTVCQSICLPVSSLRMKRVNFKDD